MPVIALARDLKISSLGCPTYHFFIYHLFLLVGEGIEVLQGELTVHGEKQREAIPTNSREQDGEQPVMGPSHVRLGEGCKS